MRRRARDGRGRLVAAAELRERSARLAALAVRYLDDGEPSEALSLLSFARRARRLAEVGGAEICDACGAPTLPGDEEPCLCDACEACGRDPCVCDVAPRGPIALGRFLAAARALGAEEVDLDP